VIKDQEEFGAIGAKALQRVWIAGWKIPDISRSDVLYISTSLWIEDGDTATTIGHKSPFGSKMPVKLSDAARAKAHVDARDSLRDGEIVLRDLPSPASVLDALWGVVE
jgi:hypothetical protein